MDDIRTKVPMDVGAMPQGVQPVGPEQLKRFTQVLMKYNSGLAQTKQRIIASENWWKLRNSMEENGVTGSGRDNGFQSRSGWLHNVIVSKHADAVEAYPQPNILPREAGDRAEARKLSAIIPCVLEQNGFERTYSDAMWQKCKTGTGAYKIVWDSGKLGGLGDISIERVNLLNIYWEPGVEDIQKGRYFFHTELWDKDLLEQKHPELTDKLKGNTFLSSKFLYDDTVDTENKVTVIEVYYHKYVDGKNTLQYCKYVNDNVLFATENDPEMAVRGLYDHGLYPYDFDPLFPIEGSPCGYGFVDVCRNPQTEIDLMKTSFVKSSQVGATPRFFARGDGAVNEEEFLDLSRPIVHVNGNLSEDGLRQITFSPLNNVYVDLMDRTIQELRETSGNTETSTGNVTSGVTAASAIAALQEASGKGSRDSTKAAYRSFERIVQLCIELIRQFYSLPRQFRILGQYGTEQYITYSNEGLRPQHQGNDFGEDMGFRMPVFDVKVSAQKKNVYTTVTQNELALQFFQMGFFNPQMTDQALMCLDLMEFDGKDTVMQKVSQNGTMFQKLTQYMQLSLMLAQKAAPEMVAGLSQDVMNTVGGGVQASAAQTPSAPVTEQKKQEPALVANARERAAEASQPDGAVARKGEKK
jgi:hypothetical protein